MKLEKQKFENDGNQEVGTEARSADKRSYRQTKSLSEDENRNAFQGLRSNSLKEVLIKQRIGGSPDTILSETSLDFEESSISEGGSRRSRTRKQREDGLDETLFSCSAVDKMIRRSGKAV